MEKSVNTHTETPPLEIVPLGGLGEFGLNMMAMSLGDTMMVIDVGLMFPDAELLGVDLVIPDMTYLFDRWIWGWGAGGFHLTQVVLHSINAVLVLLQATDSVGDLVWSMAALEFLSRLDALAFQVWMMGHYRFLGQPKLKTTSAALMTPHTAG